MPGLFLVAGDISMQYDCENMFGVIDDDMPYIKEHVHKRKISIGRIGLRVWNTESQPVEALGGNILLVLDGRIHEGRNIVDAKECLRRYIDNGIDSLAGLNGAYAIIIHDARDGSTHFVNDRYGFRVHYFLETRNSFAIAPEVKCLLPMHGGNGKIEPSAVHEFLSVGEFWGGRTFWSGIKSFPPATVASFMNGQLFCKQYWTFAYSPSYGNSRKKTVDSLVEAFREGSLRRFDQKIRNGITLSGGLDSRTVFASLPEVLRRQLVLFTFGLKDCDEVKIAKAVSRGLGCKSHRVIPTPPGIVLDNARYEIESTDGLGYMGVSFARPASVFMSKEVDVIFDGYALDLTLGGSYLDHRCEMAKSKEDIKSILLGRVLFDTESCKKLFRPSIFKQYEGRHRAAFEEEWGKIQSDDTLDIADEFALRTHVAYMHVGDVTVRRYLEISHPSADNDFCDILLGIPVRSRLRHGIYREFLMRLSFAASMYPYQRTMLSPLMPVSSWRFASGLIRRKEAIKRRIYNTTGGLINLKNRRAYVDFPGWFNTDKEWQGYFSALFDPRESRISEYVDIGYVNQMFDATKGGKEDYSAKLMMLGSLELFLRNLNKK